MYLKEIIYGAISNVARSAMKRGIISIIRITFIIDVIFLVYQKLYCCEDVDRIFI